MFSKIGNDKPIPMEYVEFKFCERLGCLPNDLDDIPEETLALWLTFMGIEAEAAKIRAYSK